MTRGRQREFSEFVYRLAQASAEVIRPYFAAPDLVIELKADATPVTVADRKGERVMRDLIERVYPDHGIMGEEYGSLRREAEYVWVLDPIDGTKAFAAGCPLFGTLICLQWMGQPVIGAIHQPVMSQFLIGDGSQTTLNGHPVRVRSQPNIDDALLLTTDLDTPCQYQSTAGWRKLVARAAAVRTWGDCYGYLLLACGGADIMADAIMSPWDLAALIPIVEGAGGLITDWQGNVPVKANSIVAAGRELHAQVIETLNPH